jgi:general secretion pathway protein K
MRRRGAAVLVALLVSVLATVLVTDLFWRQYALLRTVENRQADAQMGLLLRGALDWARAILQDQSHPNYDALSDPWAQPLARTRLADLGEDSPLAGEAALEGGIEDAQGRFNLRNLLGPAGELVPAQVDSLQRLADAVGAPPGTGMRVAAYLHACYQTGPAGAAAPGADTTPRPLAPVFPGDLALVPGIDPGVAGRLTPFVILLDGAGTAVNFNTARPEVMSAVVPTLALGDARAVAADRDQRYFRDLGDLQNRLSTHIGSATLSGVSVNSSYFLVRGTVSIGRAVRTRQALVRRGASGGSATNLLWERDL